MTFSKVTLILTLVFVLSQVQCFGQSQGVSILRSALSYSGSNQQINQGNNSFILYQSVGQEGIAGTISNNNLTLLQGYLQPELRRINALVSPVALDVDVRRAPYSNQYIITVNEQTNSIYLSVYNTLGQKKYAQKINGSQEACVDLSNFPAGCYIITVQANQKHFSTKLITN